MDSVDCPLQWILCRRNRMFGEREKKTQKTAHLLTCHLVLTAHGAVDVAACLPMAMEQLHYLLVNSSVRRGLCIA